MTLLTSLRRIKYIMLQDQSSTFWVNVSIFLDPSVWPQSAATPFPWPWDTHLGWKSLTAPIDLCGSRDLPVVEFYPHNINIASQTQVWKGLFYNPLYYMQSVWPFGPHAWKRAPAFFLVNWNRCPWNRCPYCSANWPSGRQASLLARNDCPL